LTPTATRQATLTMRPPSRTLIAKAFGQIGPVFSLRPALVSHLAEMYSFR
jgi:hypothetical protein